MAKCFLKFKLRKESRNLDKYMEFLADLRKKFNLDLDGYKRPQMERRINSLMRTLGMKDYKDFVFQMQKDKNIYNRFIDHITINVSEFFRNEAQWNVLKEKIIPLLLKERKNLKIWSAGCSTGEEPYTLAMVLNEYFPHGKHKILATDFDMGVLNKANEGLYSNKQIEAIPKNLLKKYFNIHKSGFQANDKLKNIITFKRHNLLKDPFDNDFDLILCRNVVIYFTEETKTNLYTRFYNSLRNNGILFTGSTEQIIQAREIGFTSVALFFYQKS